MPDIGTELISQSEIKLSPLESVGKFVKEKIIDPHTPEAHYRDIMKKYFWVTDKLEGRSLELTRRLRPTVEIAARAAGWSQTFTELYFAGQAVALLGFLGLRGLKSTTEIFRGMARRHGAESAEVVMSAAAGTGAVASGRRVSQEPATDLLDVLNRENASESVEDLSLSRAGKPDNKKKKINQQDKSPRSAKAIPTDIREDDVAPKKTHLKAKYRREQDRRRRGIPNAVDDEHVSLDRRLTGMPVSAISGNGRDRQDPVTRSALSQEAIESIWGKAFDAAVGTDAAGLAQKDATVGLLRNMMMDKSNDGFFSELARAMAEPNKDIRTQMVETAVKEAAQAFGANGDAAAAAQLLIEYLTGTSTASGSAK